MLSLPGQSSLPSLGFNRGDGFGMSLATNPFKVGFVVLYLLRNSGAAQRVCWKRAMTDGVTAAHYIAVSTHAPPTALIFSSACDLN